MFEPLADPAFLAQVRVDPEAGTIAWPNGVDMAPEPLYAEARLGVNERADKLAPHLIDRRSGTSRHTVDRSHEVAIGLVVPS